MNKAEPLSLAIADGHLRVAGKLDFTTAAQMSPTLRECIAALPKSFTVDLTRLLEFNSAVLVFMLECVRLSTKADKQCRFTGATPALGNLLEMASLGDLIQAS